VLNVVAQVCKPEDRRPSATSTGKWLMRGTAYHRHLTQTEVLNKSWMRLATK